LLNISISSELWLCTSRNVLRIIITGHAAIG